MVTLHILLNRLCILSFHLFMLIFVLASKHELTKQVLPPVFQNEALQLRILVKMIGASTRKFHKYSQFRQYVKINNCCIRMTIDFPLEVSKPRRVLDIDRSRNTRFWTQLTILELVFCSSKLTES